MEFLQPGSLAEAVAAKAEYPAAVPIAGGTDVMVEINFDARRPEVLLDLNRVSELTSWQRDNGQVRLGAGVPDDLDIREALAGNLCRCTGYEKIMDAVRLAAARMAGEIA